MSIMPMICLVNGGYLNKSKTDIQILELDTENLNNQDKVNLCLDIYNNSIGDKFLPHVPAYIKDWYEVLDNKGVDWNCWKVLVSESKIIGFYLLVGNVNSKKGLLQLFAIDTNFQGNGFGRLLLEDCLNKMDELECKYKIAFAKRDMKDTIAFYQKVWGKVDFNKNMLDEYGDHIVEINFNRRPKMQK